jgi:hypothetical protein
VVSLWQGDGAAVPPPYTPRPLMHGSHRVNPVAPALTDEKFGLLCATPPNITGNVQSAPEFNDTGAGYGLAGQHRGSSYVRPAEVSRHNGAKDWFAPSVT